MRHFALPALLTLSLAAAQGITPVPPPSAVQEAANTRTVVAMYRALKQRDRRAYESFLPAPLTSALLAGKQSFPFNLFARVPDARVDVHTVVARGNRVTVTFTVSATPGQTAHSGTRQAGRTTRRTVLHGARDYEFRNGRIVSGTLVRAEYCTAPCSFRAAAVKQPGRGP